MTDINTLSSDKIKTLRKDNGWSQELLAKASGLSLRTIQRIEKEGGGSAETQLALAATFNISPKELFHVSSSLEVNWKIKSIIQNVLALTVVIGVIIMLLFFSGNLRYFIDYASAIFLFLFMYSATIIAFGSHGFIKSILGLKYLFTSEVSATPASQYLAIIFKKQILFLYGGALVALLIGSIAIHSNITETLTFHRAYAVNILVLFYAALFSEGILRPLAIKLESREAISHQK